MQRDFYERTEKAEIGEKVGQSCSKLVAYAGHRTPAKVLKTESDILSDYEDLFTGLGCIPGVYHIEADPNITPVVHAPRKVPVALKIKIETELKRMASLGVITKQTEPTDWVNSMVTVTKPNKVCLVAAASATHSRRSGS